MSVVHFFYCLDHCICGVLGYDMVTCNVFYIDIPVNMAFVDFVNPDCRAFEPNEHTLGFVMVPFYT